MVGMGLPEVDRCRCRSIPLIPGMLISAIRHAVRDNCRECKKSSAEAKVSALYPNDFIRPLAASRTDSSSSTIEITGLVFGTGPPGAPNARRSRIVPRRLMRHQYCRNSGPRRLYVGVGRVVGRLFCP